MGDRARWRPVDAGGQRRAEMSADGLEGEQAQLMALVESLADAPGPDDATDSAVEAPPGDQATSDGVEPVDDGDHADQLAETGTEVGKGHEAGDADGGEADDPDEIEQAGQLDEVMEVDEADQGVVVVEGPKARASDIKQRVEHRLSELSAQEQQLVEELAADSARGGKVDEGGQLEALDALTLVAAGVLPGPLRSSTAPGADVVDGAGQLWDHKTVWSSSDWDAPRVVSRWQTRDIAKGEQLIVNVERLRHQDRAELAGELARRGLSGHVVYYPPQATR